MRDLVLHFGDGHVDGSGIDIVGRFNFQGHYDHEGNVVLIKLYLGRHQVLYTGRYDGEGTIFGEWSIGELWRGPFALRPENFTVPATVGIVSIAAEPPMGEESAKVKTGHGTDAAGPSGSSADPLDQRHLSHRVGGFTGVNPWPPMDLSIQQ
jgi:hypothetical protein